MARSRERSPRFRSTRIAKWTAYPANGSDPTRQNLAYSPRSPFLKGTREARRMWIRLGSFAIKAGSEAALRATYNEQAVPKVRAQPGNLGCACCSSPRCPMSARRHHAVAGFALPPTATKAVGTAAEVVALVIGFFAGPPTLRSYESASIGGLAGRCLRRKQTSLRQKGSRGRAWPRGGGTAPLRNDDYCLPFCACG